MVEVGLAAVEHAEIRGLKPHTRDPSGAASDCKRGCGPKTYHIELLRILLSVHPSTTTHAASLRFCLQNKFTLSRPLQGLVLRSFYFDTGGPDKTQQLASHRRRHNFLVLALGRQLSIALMQAGNRDVPSWDLGLLSIGSG